MSSRQITLKDTGRANKMSKQASRHKLCDAITGFGPSICNLSP